MSDAPSGIDIARAARTVLARLARPRNRLFPDPDGGFSVRRAGARPGRTRIDASLLRALLARGLIVQGDVAFDATDAGRAFLARALAAERGQDPFAAQHRDTATIEIEDVTGARGRVVVNRAESVLARLYAQKRLDARALAAGEKLRRDYTMAHLSPRLCVDLSAPVVLGTRAGAGALNLSDAAIAARQRFARAMTAAGPDFSGLLFDICCALTPLEKIEAARNWPRRSGRVVLAMALERLAAHYGIRDGSRPGVIRAWREETDAAL